MTYLHDPRYRAAGPYPVIRVQERNTEYARIIYDDFAGPASEFTAITQYLYHHWVATNTEVGEMWKNIALVEMDHLDMLGQVIVLLGGDPRYWNRDMSYWNGSYVNYGTHLCDRLRRDLEGEKIAQENYRRHRDQIGDPYIKEILARIIRDEEVHAQLVEEAINRYC